jgi:uncharacterized protein YoxC
MALWWQVPLVLCAVALSVALVAAIVALRQTLRRTEQLLARLERELGPTLEDTRRLIQEAQAAAHEARYVTARIAAIIDHVGQVTETVGALAMGLRGLTRVGQLVGLAVAARKGFEVFTRRLAAPRGGTHGS